LHDGVDKPELSGRIVQLFERDDDDCTGQENDKGRENGSDSQLGADSHLMAPNPDKPVGVKRKSRLAKNPTGNTNHASTKLEKNVRITQRFFNNRYKR